MRESYFIYHMSWFIYIPYLNLAKEATWLWLSLQPYIIKSSCLILLVSLISASYR